MNKEKKWIYYSPGSVFKLCPNELQKNIRHGSYCHVYQLMLIYSNI